MVQWAALWDADRRVEEAVALPPSNLRGETRHFSKQDVVLPCTVLHVGLSMLSVLIIHFAHRKYAESIEMGEIH